MHLMAVASILLTNLRRAENYALCAQKARDLADGFWLVCFDVGDPLGKCCSGPNGIS